MADEIEIVIEDAGTEAEAPDIAKSLDAEAGIEDFQRKLAEQTEARERAEAARAAAAADADRARREASVAIADRKSSEIAMVDNAISALESERSMAKTRLKQAHIDQDLDAMVEAQEEIAKLAAKDMHLRSGKSEMERRAKEPARQEIADPVERLAQTLAPKSAQWIRSHPEYASSRFHEVATAHEFIKARGIEIESPQYFQEVERILGIEKPKAPAQAQRREAAPPSAPVSPSVNGTQTNVVRLTAEEREMAASMGISDKAWAANKLQLQREGKIGHG